MVLLTGLLSAASINFGTGVGGFESNTATFVNVPTLAPAAWHAPIGPSIWESTQADSLNPAIPNGTIVDFYFLFNLVGSPTGGTVSLLVDDSAKVNLNGHTLINNMGSPQGEHCSATLPNCVTVATLSLSSFLVTGLNRFDVFVQQDGHAQYGLDVFGTASSTGGMVPEPATYGLMGVGLVGLGLWKRRK